MTLIAFLYAAFVVLNVIITGIDVPGYASMITVVLFLGGVQLISLGLLGEFVSRLFTEVKSRPLYIIEGIYAKKKAEGDTGASRDENG